nr:reverse transcriptase domain-containing protein [Tanacetum cinerariifolium]
TYARGLIEVSSTKAIVETLVVAIPVQNGSGNSMETIDIKYEWQPSRYDTCKIFDHIDDQCPKKVKVAASNQESDDEFTKVTRKHGKGKQNAVDEVSNQFVNTLYGYFIGKRLTFPIGENYVKNTWAKYVLERVILNNGFFFFQFSTREGMEQVLENGPWLIHLVPIILNTYSTLKKDEIIAAHVWVKLHNIPIIAYSEVKVAASNQESDDEFTKVTRKHGKGKQNGDRNRYMRDYAAYEQFVALCEQEAEGLISGPKRKRSYIPRERDDAEQRLIDDYFGDNKFLPEYPEENFRRRRVTCGYPWPVYWKVLWPSPEGYLWVSMAWAMGKPQGLWTRVPIGLYPCHIEEKITIKEFPGKFRGYKLATEKVVEENEGLKEVWEHIERSTLVLESLYNYDGQHNYSRAPAQVDLQIVTQVTANVNNANKGNGNDGNNGCSYKTFTAYNPKEFNGKGGPVALTHWIEKMNLVFDNSGCIVNQRVRGREAAIGMSWNDFKALLLEEFCPSNEMEKLENEFGNHTIIGSNHVAYTDRFHKLAKLVPHLVSPESSRIKRYINGLAPQICGMLRATHPATIQSAILTARILIDEAVRCGTLTKGNDKRNEMEESSKQGSTWKENNKSKTGSGFVATVPPRNDNCWAPIRQVVPENVVRMRQNQRACYECGSLEVETSKEPVSFRGKQEHSKQWEPKIADGEGVKVDRVIRDLEIPIKEGGILRVQRERTLGAAKALMNAKIDKHRISDIHVVRDFTNVFLKDLLGLPPQRQVQFLIDLVPGATPVVKSPYRLAPSEMQELSGQLQELQDKGFSKTKQEHEVHLKLVLELPRKEKLYAKFSKCEFWIQEVHLFGHVVNQSGIHVDPSKIEAVKN